MSKSSPTVASLAVQLVRLADEQQALRSLILETLREMLRISALQAEATNAFMRIAEQQQQVLQVSLNVGPGTSRDRTEQAEYEEWRRALDDARTVVQPADSA